MGASSGIGLRVAEAFASRGVKVGMAARHTESMRELKKQYPDMIEYESIDVTHTNAPELLGKLIEKNSGCTDGTSANRYFPPMFLRD